jgi:N-acetyl-gamma-glutamyl-phosphate reductase
MKKVFIDGQVGTTGLQIKELLEARSDIELVAIEDEKRKDAARKKEIINSVDLTILCLPDAAAKESVKLVESSSTKIIDASTAHRINPSWSYGFPELNSSQRSKISSARFVANPGCHATGFIAALNPLREAEVVGANYPASTTSITGFSGGGKQLIEKYENLPANSQSFATRPYGFTLTHKHLPEMKTYSNLNHSPQFYPIVGNFERGMLVSLPLFTHLLNKKVDAKDVRDILANHYANEKFINVYDFDDSEKLEEGFLSATNCNNTNRLDLLVFGHEEQITVVARLDNLGKGASGAAIQNMNIMLGLDESTGLTA